MGVGVSLALLILLLASGVSAQEVSFIEHRDFAVGAFPTSVAVGDFNGDGVQDLAVANFNSNNVSVLLGNGDGSFQAARNFGVGFNPVSVAVGDFNCDGVQDLAVANFNSANVSVLLGNGDGSFRAAQNFAVGTLPSSVAVGDFNGDGVQDLAVANSGLEEVSGSANVSVLLGNGDGSFQGARNFAAGSLPYSVAVGDFNGDGLPDLAVANAYSNNVSVLINNTPIPKQRSNGKR
jgi:VCBS repeat protein